MALPNITTKIINSDDYNERKILASDVNQIKQAIQTGLLDIKPSDIHMEGNVITADGGQNWIRRSGNKFQYYDAGTWKEITTATNTATFTAGENIAIRDVVYLKVSDGKIYKASNTNYDWIGVAKNTIYKATTGEVYLNNSVIGGFTGLTRGAWYGLSDTAGSITLNKKEVGIAISSTQLIIIKNNTTELNNLYKLQGEKAINDVSATNSGVLAGSSQVLIDKFLDLTGQNNTVDTEDTDALFVTNLFECNKYLTTNPVVNSSFESVGDWIYSEVDSNSSHTGSYSNSWATKGAYSYNITKSGIYAVSGNYAQILQNVDFTNIDKLYFDYNFWQEYTYYRVDVYIDGSLVYNSSVTGDHYNVVIDCSSITGTKSLVFRLSCISSLDRTGAAGLYIDNIRSAGTVYFDSTIQSVSTTIPSGKTKVFVTPLMYEALATGDSITADVSIDNGAHYTTGVPINTWTPITSANGTQLIVKMNLDSSTGTTTPKVSGWRVLLE